MFVVAKLRCDGWGELSFKKNILVNFTIFYDIFAISFVCLFLKVSFCVRLFMDVVGRNSLVFCRFVMKNRVKNLIENFVFYHNEKRTILCNFVKLKCE